jgi:hypothetical protein
MSHHTKLVTAFAALSLLAAACGGGAVTTTTEGPAPTTTQGPAPTTTEAAVTTTTVAATTTTAPAVTTTTTEAPPTGPTTAVPGTLLVANDDGVFEVTLSGTVNTIVDGGIIHVAIDDTQGGIIFQPRVQPWSVFGTDSIVYRIAAGASAASTFLIPTSDQGLSLEDVVNIGGVRAYYTRLDTSAGGDNYIQTLRRYDLASSTVTELTVVGGWESGSTNISAGGDRILRNWSGEGWEGIEMMNLAGDEIDLLGTPNSDGAFDCRPECAHAATLSPDGTKLAFAHQVLSQLVINLVDVDTGINIDSYVMSWPIGGYVDSIDVSNDYIVVNTIEEGSETPTKPRIINIATGEVTLSPVMGRAFFTRAVINTGGVVDWP